MPPHNSYHRPGNRAIFLCQTYISKGYNFLHCQFSLSYRPILVFCYAPIY